MKKLFCIISLGLSAIYNVQAQYSDYLYANPYEITTTGVNLEETEDLIEINLQGSDTWEQVQFDLWVPSSVQIDYSVIVPGDLIVIDRAGQRLHQCTGNIDTEDTREGFNHYILGVTTGKNNSLLKSKEGTLMKLYVSASTAGIYPVYLTKMVFSKTGKKITCEGNTSFVKVGNAKTGTIAIEKLLPEQVSSALNSETAITSLDLTKCTQINGTLDLKDGRDLIIDSDVPATKATYTRAGNDYQWGTLCVPFSFSTEGDVKYYTLKEVEGEKMVFTSIDESTIAAGTPVVFKRAKNAPLSIASGENINLTKPVEGAIANALTTTGSFVKTTAAGYYIAQDKFWPGSGFTVPAFRSYFAGSPSQASYRIVVDDEVAGISELEMDENGNLHEVYNLQGQHIAAPINGQVNIIDGKKAIMK